MNIIKHHYLENTLQRSEVKHDGIEYLRIARWVKSSGELMPIGEGSVPTWRQTSGTENASSLCRGSSQELERLFVATLIRQNEESGAIAPTYRTLRIGETIEKGDQYSADEGKTWKPTGAAGCYTDCIDYVRYRRAISGRHPDAAE